MIQWIQQAAGHLADAVNFFLYPAAKFLARYVWQWPEHFPLLAAVLLGTGLFMTLRLVFIQVRGFRHAVAITLGRYDDPEDEGDLAHFQALTTALSATVGIGNIAGVALAIRLGGPGALFWMWMTAFFGMALKYAECTLSLAYRDVHPDGSVSGGPMYYIEKGLGRRWKPMAIFFACCAMVSSFGSGNMNQSNTMADQVHAHFGIPTVWTALVFAFLVALVIIGGIRRIGRVTAILAPGMAALYVAGALVILAIHYRQIPGGLALIVTQAFAPKSLVGGAAGSFLMTFLWGVRRGLFSNEAGQGSAPIAHATAKTKEPVREGLVASLGPFIDTLVICTMTGLVIVMTGAWKEKVEQTLPLQQLRILAVDASWETPTGDLPGTAGAGTVELRAPVRAGRAPRVEFVHLGARVEEPVVLNAEGRPFTGNLVLEPGGATAVAESGEGLSVRGRALLTGAPLTARGFKHGLPGRWGDLVVTLAVILFAVSTAISWSYYGDRATEYLFGARAILPYRWAFVTFFFLGAILPLNAVWLFGDVALGLMSFPNLVALILLSGRTARMTRDYFSRSPERPRRGIRG